MIEMKRDPNGEQTYSYTLRCHYRLSEGSMWDLDIMDYDKEMTDETIREGFESIMAENVFAPFGLSIISIDFIEKIVVIKEDVEE